ncbi:MAG: TonB-dependent receptor [Hyphomonadaceae bacterium]|nr:TonB-dependent receptor [Hyphomonadaceae bacterium]
MKFTRERASVLGASMLALGAMLAPSQAVAQTEPAQTEETQEDEIVVVGSRIRRDNFNSSSPIQVVTREESVRAGLASTTETLQSTSVTAGSAQINNLFGGFVVNGGQGVNTLGLRGFGPTQTLVLLNGRRLTPAGTRGAVGAADLNTIPSALVDRIDILKDGASSVYGSDAVAGVVNIITTEQLDDFVLEGQLNIPEQEGGGQTRISLSGGGSFGNLTVTGSAEYYERDTLTYGQREFSRCPVDGIRDPATGQSLEDIDPLTGEVKCWGITFGNSPGTTMNTIGTASRAGFGGPGAAVLGNFTRWRPNSGVGDGVGGRLDGFEGVNGGGFGFANRDTFDPDMLDQELITPTQTNNLFLQAQYDLGAHELYGELLYSNRTSSGLGYVQLTLDYPNNGLLLPAELRTGSPFAVLSTFPATLPTNVPMPAPYATQVRAFTGFGNTSATQDVTYTRYVAGLRGDLGFADEWRYDFNVYHGKNEADNVQENFLVDRVFNSLVVVEAPGGTPAHLTRTVPWDPDGAGPLAPGARYMCAITATNPGYGCIPAPPVTSSTVGGKYPSDWVNWIQQSLLERNLYEETALQLIVDGPLFSVPAGEIQAVFGVEYRTAELDNVPDFNNINGNIYNFSSSGITRGEDSVRELFTEVEVPLLRDQAFAQSLTLNVSGRYTDYDSYGSDTTHKLGLTWEPVDTLLVRYGRGTSFRAPALFEQFLGFQSGFLANTADPCDGYGARAPTDPIRINCHAEIGNLAFLQTSGVTVFGAGGAVFDLAAETSENETYGFSWRPLQDVEGFGEFSLAIDHFSIELNDAVAQPGARNILNICYGSANPATEPYCSFVSRDPSFRLTVTNRYLNIASQVAEGYDFGARYVHTLWDGEITLVANLTNYTTQQFQLLDIFSPTDTNGRIGAPELTGDFSMNYGRGPWNFRYGFSWIDGMSDYNALGQDPETSIFILSTPDYYLHDASVEYEADSWRVIFGVRNMFDEQPPVVSSVNPLINGLGSMPIYSGLDYVGRQFFVNVSTRF